MHSAISLPSDARFSETFEAAAVGIGYVSIDGRWLRVNRTLCELWGYTPQQMVGEAKFSFLHADDISMAREDLQKLISARIKSYSRERRGIHENGSTFWIKMTASLVRTSYGNPDYIICIVEDITRAKQIEMALSAQNQLLEAIVDNLPTMIFVKRASDLRLVRLNHAGEQLLGYGRDHLIGSTDHDIFPREQADFFVRADRQALTMTEPLKIEEEPIKTEQGLRYLTTHKIAIRNSTGEPEYVLGVSLDITERKHTETLCRSILATLPARIAVIDENGRILAVNEAWEMVAGGSANLPMAPVGVGANYFEVCQRSAAHEPEAARALAGLKAVIAGDSTLFTFEYACPEIGSWFLMTAVPLRIDAGIAALVSHTDITERKKAEQVLSDANRELEHRVRERTRLLEEEIRLRKEDQQRLNWALQASGGGAWEWDAERDEVWWSDETFNLWGISAGTELKAPEIFKLVHEEDRERVRAEYEASMAERKSYRSEFRIHHKMRGIRWLMALGRPIADESRNTFRMLGISFDITERKEIEEAFTLARRLEAVGQLAGGIAHDSNNLLAAIIGSLELAQGTAKDEMTRKHIGSAMRVAEMGAAFNRRLLSLVQQRTLEPQKIKLNDRVEGLLSLLEKTVGGHISFVTDLATDLRRTLADPGEIDSALLNLAANARDAMPNGGEVVIRTMNVSIDETSPVEHPDARPGQYVCLAVEDTGTGMSDGILRRAGEPFFTTKGHRGGTGLGLSSVANFVKKSEGFMTIASEVGMGTTVRLYLPAVENDSAKATESLDDEIVSGRGEVVLLVEDNDAVRTGTRNWLEANGYVVREATNGIEAIQRLESDDSIQVVLSDLTLPGGVSGSDLADWMASARPEIKIILCSGYSADHLGRRVLSARIDVPILSKPVAPQVLSRALREAVEERKVVSGHI